MIFLFHSAKRRLLTPLVFWFAGASVCRGEGSVSRLAQSIAERANSRGELGGAGSLDLIQSLVLLCVLVFTAILLLSLAARLVNQTILAHGGMRHRFVAATAIRLSFACSSGLGAAAFLSATLCAFEVSEWPSYGSFGDWSSHAFPLIFALLLIAAAGFSIVEKEAESRLQIALSERCYRVLFEGSLAGAYKATLDGQILDCNFSFCQMLGYGSRAEFLGQPASFGYFSDADRERFNAWLVAEKHLENFEQCLRRRDGGTAWVLNTATLATGPGGSGLVINGTVLDITDLRIELPKWLRTLVNLLNRLRRKR